MGFVGRQGVQGGGERGTRLHESPVEVNHPQEAALGCRRRELGHHFDVLRKGTAALHVDHMPKVLHRRLTEMAFFGVHH